MIRRNMKKLAQSSLVILAILFFIDDSATAIERKRTALGSKLETAIGERIASLVERTGASSGIDLDDYDVTLVITNTMDRTSEGVSDDEYASQLRSSFRYLSIGTASTAGLSRLASLGVMYFAAGDGDVVISTYVVSDDSPGSGYYALEFVFDESSKNSGVLVLRESDGDELGSVDFDSSSDGDVSLVSELLKIGREPDESKVYFRYYVKPSGGAAGYIKEVNLYRIE